MVNIARSREVKQMEETFWVLGRKQEQEVVKGDDLFCMSSQHSGQISGLDFINIHFPIPSFLLLTQ